MTLLADVLDQARQGRTTAKIASTLGTPESLVEAALDHWRRLDVITAAGSACGTCAPRAGDPACAGCAVAGLGGTSR